MMTGFALARLLPWKATVALVAGARDRRRRAGPRQSDPQYPEFHPSLPGHRGVAEAGLAVDCAGRLPLSQPLMSAPAHRAPADHRAVPRPQRHAPQPGRPVARRAEDDAGRGRAGAVPRPPGLAVDLLARRADFGLMTNIAKKTRDRLAELFVIERPADRHRAALGRRHAQMAAALPRRQRGRDRQHPRGGSRLGLRLEPGRLHADLQLLPHRHAAAGAQPHAGRDRRPVHGGARQLRRMADADRDHAHALQHRHDGHGRAALQFRQRRDGAEDRHGRAGHRAQPPAHHALDLGRRADDPQGRRGARRQSRGLAACRERRRCATRWCRSTGSGRSPSC